MRKIQKYISSVRGQAFKSGFIFSLTSCGWLTLLVGSIHQASTVVLTTVPMFGFFWGISNRVVPVGFCVCLAILLVRQGCGLWEMRRLSSDIAYGALAFALVGLVLGLMGL